MDHARFYALSFALALLAGCASSPARLEKIATVSNQAEGQYAYEGTARFAIFSENIEVAIYAPYGQLIVTNQVGQIGETTLKPNERATSVPPSTLQIEGQPGTKEGVNVPRARDVTGQNAQIASGSGPGQKEGSRQATTADTAQGGSRAESDARSKMREDISKPGRREQTQQERTREAQVGPLQKEASSRPSGDEKGQSANTKSSSDAASGRSGAEISSTRAASEGSNTKSGAQAASTQTVESTGKTKESLAGGSERGSVAGGKLLARNDAASQGEQLHAETVKGITLASGTKQTVLDAEARSFEREPALHKNANAKAAVVGERFDYILDFENRTPLDLSALKIIDPLDPRLSLLLDKVRLDPSLKHTTTLENGKLLIMIPDGLKRAKRLRVFVPVVFRSPEPHS
jgi:hypothetical protein